MRTAIIDNDKTLLPSKIGVFISLGEARYDVLEILLNLGHGTEIIQFAIIEFESIYYNHFLFIYSSFCVLLNTNLIKVKHAHGHSGYHGLHFERIPVDQRVDRQRNFSISDDRCVVLIIMSAVGVN